MALIEWSDGLSVGVKAMDEQHKGLVQAVNDLHAAMLRGDSKTATGPLLQILVKYTDEHFSAEELAMQEGNYPSLLDHSKRHRELTCEVQKFVRRYELGETSLNVHLLNFLRDWLTNHIQKEDREYGPWLNAQGVY